MNWKIIPALGYIVFLNIAVSCIDDLLASHTDEMDAPLACSCPAQVEPLSKETLKEIFPGAELCWDRDGGIVLAILKDGEAHALFPEEHAGEDPR